MLTCGTAHPKGTVLSGRHCHSSLARSWWALKAKWPTRIANRAPAAGLQAANKLLGTKNLANLELATAMDSADRKQRHTTTTADNEVKPPAGTDSMETARQLRNIPGVAYAEPNYIVSMDGCPTTPSSQNSGA